MHRLHCPTNLLVLVAVVALAGGACGSSGSKSPSAATTSGSSATTANSTGTTVASTSAAGAGQAITIQSFSFHPDPLSAKTGKVTVTNMDDGTPHSLTADDKSFDTGIFLKTDGPKTITLSKTGTFTYHCQVHNFMKGTIQVT